MARPEAVPVAILVLVVVQLVATPFVNIVQRRVETAADWAALNATHEPATDRAVMRKLSVRSLNDPDPPGWMYALLEPPTAIQRIGLANAWETERPSP